MSFLFKRGTFYINGYGDRDPWNEAEDRAEERRNAADRAEERRTAAAAVAAVAAAQQQQQQVFPSKMVTL